LKNRFGDGYNLVVVKNQREDNSHLENFILTNVPGSAKVSEVSSEATYLLPKAYSKQFPEFFKKLDSHLSSLEVSSYGVSMTTLEEVFLKVEGADVKEDAKIIENIRKRRTSKLEDDDFGQEDYSISKEQISEGWAIFWVHYAALFLKRVILTKRNYREFIFNLIVPVILIVIGFGLATVQFFKDSDQRVLEPKLFPLPQRLIYNTNIQSGAGSPATLIGLLEPAGHFTTTGVSSAIGGTNTETLNTFDDILYDAAQVSPLEPHRYAHYYFHTLDYTNHRYRILSWGNTTSQEAIVASAHFMYQAILKNSINTGLVYKMVNDPMPIVQIYKDMDRGGNGFFIGFVLGISLALVPTSIMMFLMSERCSQLLHQQIISGMNKLSYWIANY
jgi:ATP-binding cassette, subfamily A (ABC1), member 3